MPVNSSPHAMAARRRLTCLMFGMRCGPQRWRNRSSSKHLIWNTCHPPQSHLSKTYGVHISRQQYGSRQPIQHLHLWIQPSMYRHVMKHRDLHLFPLCCHQMSLSPLLRSWRWFDVDVPRRNHVIPRYAAVQPPNYRTQFSAHAGEKLFAKIIVQEQLPPLL